MHTVDRECRLLDEWQALDKVDIAGIIGHIFGGNLETIQPEYFLVEFDRQRVCDAQLDLDGTINVK